MRAADAKTLPLPSVPKRRGRPPTGSAKSAAQRKREQRERDALIVWGSETERGGLTIADMTTAGVLEQLAHCVARGHHQLARTLADEAVRRAEAQHRRTA